MRNALGPASAKQRAAVAGILKTIFAQETKEEAETQWGIIIDPVLPGERAHRLTEAKALAAAVFTLSIRRTTGSRHAAAVAKGGPNATTERTSAATRRLPESNRQTLWKSGNRYQRLQRF
jgi:hypothetical protein